MAKIIIVKRRKFMKDFYAINLFGIIIARGELSPEDLNHELIHTAQAKELLFVPFYIWYVIEWTVLYFKYKDGIKAYYNIRFEREAYAHGDDLTYLQHRKHYCYMCSTRHWHGGHAVVATTLERQAMDEQGRQMQL